MEFEITISPCGDAVVDIEVSKNAIKQIKRLVDSGEYDAGEIDNLILEEELPDVYEELHSKITEALQEQLDESGDDGDAEDLDFGFVIPEELFE